MFWSASTVSCHRDFITNGDFPCQIEIRQTLPQLKPVGIEAPDKPLLAAFAIGQLKLLMQAAKTSRKEQHFYTI